MPERERPGWPDRLRGWSEREWAPIAVLALVVAGFFLPAWLRPEALIWPHSGLGSDISIRHWPDLVGYAASWQSGRMALWDSLTALGRPLPGDPDVLFLYPGDLLFIVLPPALAFSVLDGLHVFLAGLFTYLLLRLGYGVARPAALLGGLAFAFGPKLIAHLAGGHVGLVWGLTWTPAVLLGLTLGLRGSRLAAALAGAALALQMPTHIQIPYYTAGIGSAFWAWHAGPAAWRALRGGRGEWRAVAHLVGIYLIFLLAFTAVAAAMLAPLLELLPYNSRSNFTLAEADKYALPPALLLSLLVASDFQFPEWTMAVGILPLVLAGLAARWGRPQAAGFWILLAGFALIYALGTRTPLYGLAFALVPGLRWLRVPTRLWFFGSLAVALLAGLGADQLTNPRLRDQLARARRGLGKLAGIYFVGAGAAWIGYLALFRKWHWPLFFACAAAAFGVALGSAWLRGRLSGRALQWALIPVLVMELLPLAAGYIDLVDPRSEFLRSTPALDYVASQPGIFRVYSTAGDLPYALAAQRGVEALEGFLGFQIGHAGDAIRQAAGCPIGEYAAAMPPCLTRPTDGAPDAERLGRLNVRYVLSRTPLTGDGFRLVLDGDPSVYENFLWQPRVRIYPGGSAEIVARRAGEYRILVRAPEAGRLVLSETWLPGWQAIVDDDLSPRPVDRAEGALLGLALEPGEHMIQIIYSPAGWRIGWPISAAALVGLGAWTILVIGRRFMRINK